VEQFQVETSGTGVEFNGQGRKLYDRQEAHGSGFEYLRNTILDARGFFPLFVQSNIKRIRRHDRMPNHQEEAFSSFLMTVALTCY
jgi:hypothetical protein